MSTRFDLRFGRLQGLAGLAGAGAKQSWVEVSDDEVHVRMGWAFRATIPRSSIVGAEPEDMVGWVGIGVHGLRGRWQVNGTLGPGVRLDISPSVQARMSGVPVRLEHLRVGVADPSALLDALGFGAS